MSLRILNSLASQLVEYRPIHNPKVIYFYRQLMFLGSRLDCIVRKIEASIKNLHFQYFFENF
jgi:hypothetical protein